jgi:predicted nucleic acid-binding protein
MATKEDFYKSIEIMTSLLKVGKPIPAIDVIIASMCINRKFSLLTKDEHFKWIKEVESEFKIKLV